MEKLEEREIEGSTIERLKKEKSQFEAREKDTFQAGYTTGYEFSHGMPYRLFRALSEECTCAGEVLSTLEKFTWTSSLDRQLFEDRAFEKGFITGVKAFWQKVQGQL
jgi:hypothetical protein